MQEILGKNPANSLEELTDKMFAIQREVDQQLAGKTPEEKIALSQKFNSFMLLSTTLDLMQRALFKGVLEATETTRQIDSNFGYNPQDISNELSVLNKTKSLFDSQGQVRLWTENITELTKTAPRYLSKDFIDSLDAFKEKSLRALDDSFEDRLSNYSSGALSLKSPRTQDQVAQELSQILSFEFFKNPNIKTDDLLGVARQLSILIKGKIEGKALEQLKRDAQNTLAKFLTVTLKKPDLIYAYAQERQFPVPSDMDLFVPINLAVANSRRNIKSRS